MTNMALDLVSGQVSLAASAFSCDNREERALWGLSLKDKNVFTTAAPCNINTPKDPPPHTIHDIGDGNFNIQSVGRHSPSIVDRIWKFKTRGGEECVSVHVSYLNLTKQDTQEFNIVYVPRLLNF